MTQTELFNIIEHERTKAGYTLKGFAKAIGSNKTSYNLYRNGTVNMGVQAMLRAFDLLGITITKEQKLPNHDNLVEAGRQGERALCERILRDGGMTITKVEA